MEKRCRTCRFVEEEVDSEPCRKCLNMDASCNPAEFPGWQPVDAAAPRALHDASTQDKLPLQHLPWEGLVVCAEVMRKATSKYPYENWRAGMPWMELAGSCLRHLVKWLCGEDLDKDSGQQHLAHLATDALMLLVLTMKNRGTDDRIKG